MNKITCSCSKKAFYVCEDHKVFFCESHAKTHNCKLIEIKEFQKSVESELNQTFSEIQNFKKQKTQTFFELKKINEEAITDQKEKINLILDLIQKMIELNKLKKTTFFSNYLHFDADSLESSLKDLHEKGKLFEIKEQLKKKEVFKFKQDFDQKSTDMKVFLKNEHMSKSMNSIFDYIIKKSKTILEFLQGSQFNTKVDVINNSKSVSEIFFTFDKNKIKKTMQKNEIEGTELLDGKGIRNSNLNSNVFKTNNQFKSNVISENEDEDMFDLGSSIEDTEINHPKKGTMLITNNALKKKKNNQKEKQYEIEEEAKSANKSNFSDMDMSFDADDIELEDDDSEVHDYEEEFEVNKQRFCKLLDQVLFDVNCVNFFNKNERNKINDYFESFKNILIQIIGELKSNFSKM